MDGIRVAELFAGVGGFRLGLEGYADPNRPEFDMPSAGPYETVWANQWEPPGSETKQFAWRCYEERFGKGSCVNMDIHQALDAYAAGDMNIPDVDMLVGGFPCQDYSVAKPLAKSGGINGKKGVLWWDIYRFCEMKAPKYVLLENVDRLLKSPSSQRGRDFAIILSCFASLGYSVEWRVVNSAEYGAPQRRKRVYIFAVKTDAVWDLNERLHKGVMAEALPIADLIDFLEFHVPSDPYAATTSFNTKPKADSPFLMAGVMQDGMVLTAKGTEAYQGPRMVLGDVLIPETGVPESFYVSDDKLDRWDYLKGAKREERVNKKTGFKYCYSEGAMAFPDSLDAPSRTILTGEGGASASRTKHIVRVNGRYRRLVPDELDQLQGFPRGWTDAGLSDNQRAFCVGNALVVQIPHVIGKVLAQRHAAGVE